MRGRLINPMLCELAQIDTVNTTFDPDFREPVADQRTEKAAIKVPAQIEPEQFEALQQMLAGNMPASKFVLCFHFKDLEDMGLVAADGVAAIQQGDRLVAIRDEFDNLVQAIRNPPGLFVTAATPGFAWLGKQRNLLLVTFEARDRTARAGGG